MKNVLKSSLERFTFNHTSQNITFRSSIDPDNSAEKIPFPRIELFLDGILAGALLVHNDDLLPSLPIYEFFIADELSEDMKEDVARRLLTELIETRELKTPPMIGSPELLKGDFWHKIAAERLLIVD